MPPADASPSAHPGPRSRYDHDRLSLAAAVAEVAGDVPRYRVEQIWDGLHRRLAGPDELTDLPKALRGPLAEALPAALTPVAESSDATGDTRKWLFALADGARIETVLMHYPDRSTVCVSTQAGCAMACGFCATGQAGFERHLTTGEIVEQVVRAARAARDGAPSRRLANVVFMGMGEPMANYDRVWAAVERIHAELGLSARHLTISTVGLVAGIRRLAAEALPVTLAVSLHAARDELRDELVPINRRWNLAALAQACHEHQARSNRRLTFEWALIDGVNDTPRDVAELAAYARPLRAHVNLIPLNPTPGWPTRGTPPDRVQRFAADLRAAGVNATVRANRGTDIDAACGQLAARTPVAVTTPGSRAPAP